MNKMVTHTTYITPNRTLETLSVDGSDTYLYVYNYKGVHFRLFMDIVELVQFFQLGTEPKYDFSEDTSNRTLETITVPGSDEYIYVYNYKGLHFRVFIGLREIAQFFELGTEPKYDFTNEAELDLFLEEYFNCNDAYGQLAGCP